MSQATVNASAKKPAARQTLIRVAKFVAFSLGAGIIQVLTFTLLNEVFKLDYWLSYFPALVLSVLYNFTVNRRFTFKSANKFTKAMLKVAIYYCIFKPLYTRLGNMAEDAGVNEYIVLAVTMICNMVTEFLVCRFWVYGKSMDTNDLAKKQEEKEQEKARAAAKK